MVEVIIIMISHPIIFTYIIHTYIQKYIHTSKWLVCIIVIMLTMYVHWYKPLVWKVKTPNLMEKHDQHQPTNNNLDHIHGAMAYLMYCIPEYTIVDEHSLRLCFLFSFFSLSWSFNCENFAILWLAAKIPTTLNLYINTPMS